MRILSYEYDEANGTQWKFDRVDLGMFNLVVGDSGSGKTRFLNTLFNLGRDVAGKRDHLFHGNWIVRLEQNGNFYRWELKIDPSTNGNPVVRRELLVRETDNGDATIVDRNEISFRFNDRTLPKLSRENTCIELLQGEEIIRPLYEGFSKILRRDFSKEGLGKYILYEVIPKDLLRLKVQNLDQLFHMPLGLNLKLHILKENFSDIYQSICSWYLELFPFIEEIAIKDLKSIRVPLESDALGISPIVCIKEKGIDNWLPIPELASGLQKTLLIITDIYSLPDGAIYLIDEYENSLGISIIDFLPDCLDEVESNIQVIVTSHHPYVINRVPVEDWIVFNREGWEVKVRCGPDNVKHYGRSKQQKFIQLINDPFYNREIE